MQWILKLLSKYKNEEKGIHKFSLDYSSALLANILQSERVSEILLKDQDQSLEIMTQLLDIVSDPSTSLPISTIIHVLIGLSQFSKQGFSQNIEKTGMVD